MPAVWQRYRKREAAFFTLPFQGEGRPPSVSEGGRGGVNFGANISPHPVRSSLRPTLRGGWSAAPHHVRGSPGTRKNYFAFSCLSMALACSRFGLILSAWR